MLRTANTKEVIMPVSPRRDQSASAAISRNLVVLSLLSSMPSASVSRAVDLARERACEGREVAFAPLGDLPGRSRRCRRRRCARFRSRRETPGTAPEASCGSWRGLCRRAPLRAWQGRQMRTLTKDSATMCSPEEGSRWWMSATRPKVEFSTGSMARTALPERTASMASSKLRHGSGVQPGWASRQAWCE